MNTAASRQQAFFFRELLITINNYSAMLLDYIWSEEITSALCSSMNELNLVLKSGTCEGIQF